MKKLLLMILATALIVSCSNEPETLEEYIAAGRKAVGNLEYQKAVQYLTHAIREKPSDRQLLYLLGVAYLRQNMYDSATTYLKRADILYPKDREINRELYNAAFLAEQYDIARDALRTLIATGDSEDEYLQDLANLSVAVEDFAFAHYYFGKLMEKYPDEPDRYLQNANSAAELGSLQVAIDILNLAIEEFGPKAEFEVNKGLFFAAKRDYDRAEEIFRSLVARDTARIQYQLNLAHTLSKQDDPGKMREAYELYCKNLSSYPDPQGLDSVLTRLENSLGLDSTSRRR